MKFRDFLADRMWYIGVYAFNIALVVLVIELDMLHSGISLQPGSLIYIAVLSFVGVLLYLGVEYVRQRAFYRQIEELRLNQREMHDVLHLQSAVTREQQTLQQLLQDNHRLYVDRLMQLRHQQEQHLHFVQQWVHQMKTPVSVIHLLTQPAGPTATDANPHELLRSIQEENERLQRGLEMMLHTARLDKFEMDLQVKRVDLPAVVRQVINEHKKSCIRYGIFPKIIAPDEPYVAETDEKWISFVFHQILGNAIKYSRTKEGSKTLLVEFRREQGGCSVSVRDEGIGIAEQDLPRIFEPFFTGENGRLISESTGMGLYLAKQVCERLGHRIEASSVLGEGTTVTVRFPAPQTIHATVKE